MRKLSKSLRRGEPVCLYWAYPPSTKEFVLYSDASKNGLRCALIQDDRVIAYASW